MRGGARLTAMPAFDLLAYKSVNSVVRPRGSEAHAIAERCAVSPLFILHLSSP